MVAVEQRDVDMVRLLLAAPGIDPHQRTTGDAMSALHVLAEQDHRNPAWQDETGKEEKEGGAALVAYTPILELLVEAGVDPNASNVMGEVPPFCCLSTNTRQTLIRCRMCVVCIVCVLADRASPALLAWPQGSSGLAAVARAGARRRRHQRAWRHGPPLWYAHARRWQSSLESKRLMADGDGGNGDGAASRKGHKEIVDLLLQYGASPTHEGDFGTPTQVDCPLFPRDLARARRVPPPSHATRYGSTGGRRVPAEARGLAAH
jgi:hypothetical protein